MSEIIHRYQNSYPFGLKKTTELTYLEILKENLSNEKMSDYKLKFKILKEMDSRYFVRPIRIFRDGQNLHLHYEYYPLSVEKYIESVNLHGHGNTEEMLRSFVLDFEGSINRVIEVLIHYQIKSYLPMGNLVVADSGEKISIRAFIEPDSQCLGLHLPFSTEDHDVLKLHIQQNRNKLQEFYLAEKKRLAIQIKQIIEKKNGKVEGIHTEVSPPNFIINGSKLVFLRDDKEKRSIIEQRSGSRLQKNEEHKAEHSMAQTKKELLEKNSKKIEEIKNHLNNLSHKNQHIPIHPSEVDKQLRKNHQEAVVFKPQQITKEKQTKLEERDYQQSLEDELNVLMNLKKLKQERSVEKRRASPGIKHLKELNLLTSKSQENFSKDKKEEKQEKRPEKKQQRKQLKKQQKDEKTNKYKMKITTSHEIEIEGAKDKDIKDVEKDIVEGLRSGKINVNDIGVVTGQKTSNIQIQTIDPKLEEKGESHEEEQGCDKVAKKKKISDIMDQITSNNAQQAAEDAKKQAFAEHRHEKIGRHNTIAEGELPNEHFFDKIKEAKIRAEVALKNCVKTRKQ